MTTSTLHDLFISELQDLYDAEHRLLQTLPDLETAATDETLKAEFSEHRRQTEEHVKRLEQVFESIDEPPRREMCQGMEGILREGGKILEQDAPPSVKDAALISAAQRAEHYEIAGYGTARSYARLMNHADAAGLLEKTLMEEKEVDHKLTEIAESTVNPTAMAL